MAAQPPPLDAAARDVPRPDDDVRPFVERADEVRQVLGVVREIGVHLEEAVVAFAQALIERLQIRRSQPELARAVHDSDVVVLGGDGVGQVTGAVGRSVVDDEDVGVGRGCAHPVQKAGEIVTLVVSRRDDESPRFAVRRHRFDLGGL